MKKIMLTLLLSTTYLYGAPPHKAKPTPTPTPPPETTGPTYYQWLNDFAHWIETHPPTPDQ